MPELDPLLTACGEPGTETAQRFLTSAFESVEAVLQTLKTMRNLRRDQGGDIRGRLTSPESSLQSAVEVQNTAGALASATQSCAKRVSGLKTLFVARNEISHELEPGYGCGVRRGGLDVYLDDHHAGSPMGRDLAQMIASRAAGAPCIAPNGRRLIDSPIPFRLLAPIAPRLGAL